jgi:heme/copper-type cytochrome/quinol oxidase subunit 2
MPPKITFLWVLLGLLVGIILVAPIPVSAAAPTERTITVNASSFAYDPAVIKVNRGDLVTLELVSTDVAHGLYIDGYGLDVVAEPGQTSSLTFSADRAGSFRVRCSLTCGDLHPFMIGKLEVGHKGLFWRAAGLSLVAVLAGLLLQYPKTTIKAS